MSLIGFSFLSVNAKANSKVSNENVEIKIAPPVIDNIEKKDLSSLGITDSVKIDFKFATHYLPDFGEILLSGEVIYKVTDAEKFVKDWYGGKSDEKMIADILNIIFKRCLLKVVELSDMLKLPPPVAFPAIMPASKE